MFAVSGNVMFRGMRGLPASIHAILISSASDFDESAINLFVNPWVRFQSVR